MPSNSRPSQFTESALRSTGAYELVFSALLLGFLGYAIDRWIGTSPFFVIVFSILGFLGGAISLFYRFKHEMSLLAEEES